MPESIPQPLPQSAADEEEEVMCEDCGDEFTMAEMAAHMHSDHPEQAAQWMANRAAAAAVTAAASSLPAPASSAVEEEEEEEMCELCGDECDTLAEMLAHMHAEHPAEVAAYKARKDLEAAAKQQASKQSNPSSPSPAPAPSSRPKSLLLSGGDGEDFVFDIPVAPATAASSKSPSANRNSVDLGGFEIPLVAASAAPVITTSPVRKPGRPLSGIIEITDAGRNDSDSTSVSGPMSVFYIILFCIFVILENSQRREREREITQQRTGSRPPLLQSKGSPFIALCALVLC